MKKLKQQLASMAGVEILSKDQIRSISGGAGKYSNFGVSCACMQGGSVGTANCDDCERYCSTRGGQSNESDCCVEVTE